jgi:undecaprenyl-diphosphatase
MNAYLQAIILGVVQGVSEFMPISSDGHLVIVKHLLSWLGGGAVLSEGKEFEVLLHIGTLASILAVYAPDIRRELWNFRLWGLVVLATIPAIVVGLTLEDYFDRAFSAPVMAGYGLLVTATLLLVGQRFEAEKYDLQTLPWMSAGIVGLFQALALLPGVSRSGCTISGGLLTGVDRVSATRFSFFMAIPVTAGAIALTVKRAIENGGTSVPIGPVLVGIAISFLVGWLSLRVLIRLMTQRRLHWFAAYCVVLGLITIAVTSGTSSAPASAANAHAVVTPTAVGRR